MMAPDLVDILRRIKEHWEDGTTVEMESADSWHGTMGAILRELE
jgi:hypothetical protein